MELVVIIILTIAAVGVSTVIGDLLSRRVKGEKQPEYLEEDILEPAAALLGRYLFGPDASTQPDAIRGLLQEIAQAWEIPESERQDRIERLMAGHWAADEEPEDLYII